MGRYGQAILTIVGTAVGAYFGAPQLGALLGSLAGSLLFPAKLPTQQGPRLSDLTTTNSTVGAPIMEGWGCFVVPGTIIHQTDIREVIETEEVGGGSGGPSQKTETPTYFSDWAVALVDCPDEPILAVRTIWANGKPIYDRRPQGAGESDTAFSARMAANSQLDEQMVVYLGTDDQEPDPTLEAFYGVGGVSAHKQLAYIVFSNWQHKAEDGGRIPLNLKIEIIGAGSIDTQTSVLWENEVLFPWAAGGFPENSQNEHAYAIHAAGFPGFEPPEGEPITSIAQGLSIVSTYRGKDVGIYQGTATHKAALGGVQIGSLDVMGYENAFQADWYKVYLHFNTFNSTGQPYSTGGPGSKPVGSNYCQRINNWVGLGQTVLTDDGYTNPTIFTDTGNKIYMKLAPGGDTTQPYWDEVMFQCDGGDANEHIWLLTSIGCVISLERVPRAPDDPAAPLGRDPYPKLAGTDNWFVVNGKIMQGGAWEKVTGSFRVLQQFSTNGGFDPITYPLGPAVPSTDPRFNDQTWWDQQYAAAVARGQMVSGLSYGAGDGYGAPQGYAYRKTQDNTTVDVERISVGTPVRAMMQRAGYALDQIDVSDIDGLTMIGYVRTRQMTARAAIDPLRQVKLFDGYESGRTVRFVRRGGEIRHTFDTDELGVFVAGGERPTRVSTRKLQDVDLPRSVRVHYMSQSRDYELGEQQSPARVDTTAVNDVDVEVAMVLSDTEAMQTAQILWANAWAERWVHEIQVSTRWQHLEPTDCIGVPIDGQVYRCRIVEIMDTLPAFRKFALVRDDDGAYESYAVAEAPPTQIAEPPLQVTSPAGVVPLDIPLIRDEDNDAGFYAAMYPLIAGAWRGAALYRSSDAGGNWARVAISSSAAVTGTIVVPLPSAGHTTIDGASELIVQLDGDDELVSITRDAMLNGSGGSNAAAVGADGRWEIVQFQEVEALGDGLFKLTTLLRGRRGTEHAIGSSVAGDRFVLLTGPGIVRVPLQLSDVGREYLYRAVATGLTVDSSEDVLFTGQGIALKPFRPSRVRGDRDPVTGDWAITWIRRGRIGQEMPDGAEIPLSEQEEDYEVVIRDAAGSELRVISVVETAVTYTGEQQLTDFGSLQNPLTLEIYQISAAVGRGYPATATLASVLTP